MSRRTALLQPGVCPQLAQDIDNQAVAPLHLFENGKMVGARNFAEQRR
jgi:hypothetical protein